MEREATSCILPYVDQHIPIRYLAEARWAVAEEAAKTNARNQIAVNEDDYVPLPLFETHINEWTQEQRDAIAFEIALSEYVLRDVLDTAEDRVSSSTAAVTEVWSDALRDARTVNWKLQKEVDLVNAMRQKRQREFRSEEETTAKERRRLEMTCDAIKRRLRQENRKHAFLQRLAGA